jgi:hypothetical protein
MAATTRLRPELFVGRAAASPQAAADWSSRRIVQSNLRAVGAGLSPDQRPVPREVVVFFEILMPFLTSAFVFVYRASGAARVHRFVVSAGDDRVLAQRRLDDGRSYWEKDQATSSSLRGPDGPHERPARDGARGMVMSSSRAFAVLVIATLVYA